MDRSEEAVLREMAEGCVQLAAHYRTVGERANALKMLKDALFLYGQLEESDPAACRGVLADCHSAIGHIYLHDKQYFLAQDHYFSALELRKLQQQEEKEGFDLSLLAAAYWNLSVLYYRQEDYRPMREMARMALPLYEALAEKDPDEYGEDVILLRLLLGLR